MNVFSAVLLIFFALIGVIAFMRYFTVFLFRYKPESTVMLVTPISENCDDAELILRSAATRVKWISRSKNDYVICLDCDMDDETRKICEKICNEYGFVKMINKKEFMEMMCK